MIKLLRIREVEKQLEQIVSTDKQRWTHFYLLLKEVDENKLWEEEKGINSFTAWVKNFCVKNKVHESVIWARKKAGAAYENYSKIQQAKGIEVAPIEEINIAPESLVLVDKIAKNNHEVSADLMEKALAGEMSRDDLREAYKAVRSNRNKVENKESKENKEIEEAEKVLEDKGIENIKDKKDIDEVKSNEKVKVKEDVVAAEIVSALNNYSWLEVNKEVKRVRFVSTQEQDKYRTFTEFPVYTSVSKKSRRIDVLAVENLTTEINQKVHLHAIEIKVSKGDLLNDKKYTEYAEFTDFTWLAIPESLLEFALETKFKECGIIIIKKGKAKIHTRAKKMEPLLREDTLMRLAVRLM